MRLLVAAVAFLALTAGCAPAVGPLQAAPDGRSGIVAAPVMPVAVDMPATGISADIIPLGLDGREIDIAPLDARPLDAGWYRFLGIPGDQPGRPAVVLAHVDYRGKPGAFYRLRDAKPGQQIIVKRADSTRLVYTVEWVDRLPKAEFNPKAVYATTAKPTLLLITCGGSFVGGDLGYADNILVRATLTKP